MNVCDQCADAHYYAPETLSQLGEPKPGDFCFNCRRVYDLRAVRTVTDVQDFEGNVYPLQGHTLPGWRAPTGLEKMEQSIADFKK